MNSLEGSIDALGERVVLGSNLCRPLAALLELFAD